MKHLLTALTLSLIGCGGASAPGPGDTVKELAYAMEAGDGETVAAIAPVIPQVLGNEKFDQGIEESKAKMAEEGGLESITIDSEEIDEEKGTALVKATLTMGNGESETAKFPLSRDKDGNWTVVLHSKDAGDGSDLDTKLTPDTEI